MFRAGNHDDILFVTSEQTGFGYFRNFGETRRQGLELGAERPRRTASRSARGYTFLDATFQSEETVNGESNSTNDAAGRRRAAGWKARIEIEPGDRMPLIPAHMLKAFADVAGHVGAVAGPRPRRASSSSFARGNENNQHQPDGTYYLGPGSTAGYAVVNLGATLPA